MDLKAIIKEQRQEMDATLESRRLVPRTLLPMAERYLARPNSLAIIGVRRCGKSVFSQMAVQGKRFGYINFDDERLVGVRTADLNDILEAFYGLYGDIEYIILDEVQQIKGWELFANRLRQTKRVIVTGSSSSLLSGELATHLTGRHIDIILHPFSFIEYLDLKGITVPEVRTTKDKACIITALEQYLKDGGFPEVQFLGKNILRGLYDDIIVKDIVIRHGIRKVEQLRQMTRYIITNTGEEVSYSRLSRSFGIDHVSTVSNWISYLCQAFLIIKLERFDFKLRQHFKTPKKVYCVDTGILDAVGFNLSENRGRVIENLVAMDLERKAAMSEGAMEIFYWRDAQGKEVDFVIKEGRKVTGLVQVTYANRVEDIKEREMKGILAASRALKCKDLMVITWDLEAEKIVDGSKITFVPLWKWLLGT